MQPQLATQQDLAYKSHTPMIRLCQAVYGGAVQAVCVCTPSSLFVLEAPTLAVVASMNSAEGPQPTKINQLNGPWKWMR